MPLLPLLVNRALEPDVVNTQDGAGNDSKENNTSHITRSQSVRIRNRRKRYLDANPEYFGPELELADPLLYDRLVRRFQSAAEREMDGRAKGYSGILEADLLRSEAKIEALAHPDPSMPLQYTRGSNGEILANDGDLPESKEEGQKQWRRLMELRFLSGQDADFDYREIDDNEAWDDKTQEERDFEDAYFDKEEERWVLEESVEQLSGETGIQDF